MYLVKSKSISVVFHPDFNHKDSLQYHITVITPKTKMSSIYKVFAVSAGCFPFIIRR